MSDLPDPEQFEDPLENYEPKEYASTVAQALAEETVRAIQLRPYAELGSNASVQEAVHALHDSDVGSLLIVDGKRLVGIFTQRDVLERVAEQFAKLQDVPVSEVMTTEPTVVFDTDPAAIAVAAIAIEGHRHVPVVNSDTEIVGVVSPQRVFNFLEKQFD